MPTAPKLVAALLFAVLGWAAGRALVPALPEGMSAGNLPIAAIPLGFFAGWFVVGPGAGRGWQFGAAAGLRGSAAIFLWALILVSILKMLERSMRRMYDDPMQAILGVFALIVEYGAIAMTWPVIIILVLGGVCAGLVVETAGRHWK